MKGAASAAFGSGPDEKQAIPASAKMTIIIAVSVLPPGSADIGALSSDKGSLSLALSVRVLSVAIDIFVHVCRFITHV